MAKIFIEESTLTAIGDAIRGKTGKTELIDPANMHTEIASIEAGGGGGYEPTDEELTYTDDIQYTFYDGKNRWVFDNYKHRMSTSNLNNIQYMFHNLKDIEEIPFQFNMDPTHGAPNFKNAFYNCQNLKVCPKIRGVGKWNNGTQTTDMLNQCYRLRDVEDLFLPEELAIYKDFKITSAYSVPHTIRLQAMLSLRRMPSWWYCFQLNEESTAFPAATGTLYYYMNSQCGTLDECKNIPVWHCQGGALTSNAFNYAFQANTRIKSITFATNADGSPIETKWKGQTIDLSKEIGYAPRGTYRDRVCMYNSGITADKEVTDDTSYQALKNDPDWFTPEISYSRYNHDSAVETLNSLPDTSAYLASAGGTNTIKFKGASGELTDGGAINTLTEAEIAVATAKGWTVTLT